MSEMALAELDLSLSQNKVENPGETVYPIVSDPNKGWSLAIADIGQSQRHVHNKTTEIYIVLDGGLEVALDDDSYIRKPGGSIRIPPGVEHEAWSLNPGERARIIAISFPAWSSEDHHPV